MMPHDCPPAHPLPGLLLWLPVVLFTGWLGTVTAQPSFEEQFRTPPDEYRLVQYELNNGTLQQYPAYGIGGFMGFFYKQLYQSGTSGPGQIAPLVDAAHERGMRVWLADDFGYPSGMAGGRVVAHDPALEVRSLSMASIRGNGATPAVLELPAGAERFVHALLHPLVNGEPDLGRGRAVPVSPGRVATTGLDGPWLLCGFVTVVRGSKTQAQSTMQQFKHTGRYPDMMNPAATDLFLANMHAPILERITNAASKVEGFYTNEPNLMQVYWDNGAPSPLAFLPWTPALPEVFAAMHGYDLAPVTTALFLGQDDASRRVRLHFHQTVAELFARNYAARIRAWCHANGVLSSGHLLLNEYLAMHVTNYGDMMLFASEYDVPAIDIGIPNPDRFASFPYHQTRLFSSVATWKARDEVIVLLDPIIGGGGMKRLSPAMPLMLNAANMAIIHGGNSFTSYTPLNPRPGGDATGYTEAEYRAFNEYLGRVCLVLRGARRAAPVAVYYPIAMFQAETLPIATHWPRALPRFSARQEAWEAIQDLLLNARLEYEIVHPQGVRDAVIGDGTLGVGAGSYRVLVLPPMRYIPLDGLEQIRAFESSGGTVLWVDNVPSLGHYPAQDGTVGEALAEAKPTARGNLVRRVGEALGDADRPLRFNPGAAALATARFTRDGRDVTFIANRTDQRLDVRVTGAPGAMVMVLDPATGSGRELELPGMLALEPHLGVLLLEQ